MYYWPSRDADDPDDREMWTDDGRLLYYGQIAQLARAYIEACNDVHRTHAQLGKILDKPNAHRLIDLAMHTIPTFGHTRQCSELILETTHRVFKEWLEKNTHAASHITAIERALIRDWTGRLYALYKYWCNGTEHEKKTAERGLRRFILGAEHGQVIESDHTWVTFMAEFRELVHDSFREPVLSMMKETILVHNPRGRKNIWEGTPGNGRRREGTLTTTRAVREGLGLLQIEYGHGQGREMHDFIVCTHARFVRYHWTDPKRKSYAHGSLRPGCAVSVLREQGYDTRAQASSCSDTSFHFYLVYGIVQAEGKELWIIVKRLMETTLPRGRSSYYQAFSVFGSPVEVVELTRAVRRVAVVHVCDEKCQRDVRRKRVNHFEDPSEGASVFILSRADGYPPHLS